MNYKKLYYSLNELFDSLISILIATIARPISHFPKTKQYKTIPNNTITINIIGNGPSLSADWEQLLNQKKQNGTSFYTVNRFIANVRIHQIKPSHHFLIDPAFFSETQDKRIKNLKSEILDALNSSITWHITLVVPWQHRNTDFLKNITNDEIEIQYIENIPVWKGNESLISWLYKKRLATPPSQNVLITAIFHAMHSGTEIIKLWGADHSWMENYSVRDNKLITRDIHIDESSSKQAFIHTNKVHEEFESLAKTFKIYHLLNKTACKMGISIINCSSKSWIDAFKRIDY